MDISKLKNEEENENSLVPTGGKQLSNYLIDYIYENKEFNKKLPTEQVCEIAIRKKDCKMIKTLMTLGLFEWNVLWKLYENSGLYDTNVTKIFIDANHENFPSLTRLIFKNNDEEAFLYFTSLNSNEKWLHCCGTVSYMMGVYKIYGCTNVQIWDHLLTL